MHLRTLLTGNFLVIFYTLFSCSLPGQTANIDSLENALKTHIKKDTARVNILNEIAYSIHSADPDKTNKYSKESYALSKELNYTKGQAESLWLQGISKVQKDPQAALVFFREALQIVESTGDKKGVGKYTNAIGTVYGATGRDSLAVRYYLKAIDIAQKAKDSRGTGKYLINLSQSYNRMGRVEEALNGYNNALNELKIINDKNGIATCYTLMGNIYTSRGNYPLALECLQNGLKIREELKEMSGVSKSLVSIGSIYYTQKNFSKALEYNQKVVEIFKKSNDKHALAGSFVNIGLIYLQTNNKQALEYFNKALEISNSLKIVPLKITILLNIGQFYYKESQLVKALENFSEALALSESANRKATICFAKLQIANIYFNRKEYSKSLFNALSGLEIAKATKTIDTEKDLHKLLSEIYSAMGNYKNAFSHSQLNKQLSDSIFNENNVRQIAELEFTYKFEKEKQALVLEQHKKDAVQAARRKLQNIIIITLSVSIILVSLLALYILSLYRFKNRANRAIRIMEQEKERLLQQEIERINLELEQNRKSLAAASLKLIQNSERDAEIIKRLESTLENSTPEGKKIINAIISDFKRISRSSNWNEFELLFQKVHKSFYEKLNENFPNLTANERKLCAFLKLNMSSKDIANITFQSEEALKKARQRLRQKIGIDRDTNLVIYLQNI